ncbi:WD40-repeat-containing domain protein, partial [Gorgonomyces haynaldii]
LRHMDKSQIITHSTKGIAYTAYDVRWVPMSPRFVVLGQVPSGRGVLAVYQLVNGSIEQLTQIEKPHAFKCGTFQASAVSSRYLATGDFGGRLSMWDLNRLEQPVFSTLAHEQIINCIDGCGGLTVNGPPELATGSRDGAVKIWDVRQPDKQVATIAPADGQPKIDCWSVAFGNSFNDEERMICAGYENGDVKMFDLRAMKLLWETNVKNGVVSIEFDRRDIKMNKMVVAGLEAKFHVYDLRTHHPTDGYTSLVEKQADNTTVWAVRHLPQNRDIFMTSTGAGGLSLFKYNYPPSRVTKDKEGKHDIGVVGTVDKIQTAKVAEQPVGAFDWSNDKMGLFCFAGFDQAIRVGLVTKLERFN